MDVSFSYKKQTNSDLENDGTIKDSRDILISAPKTYEIAMVRNQTIGIKCTRKNCRFRAYFVGQEVVRGNSKEMTNITQRMPYYVSWHNYPIH